MTTGLVRACGGKSHSWLTPTMSQSKPSANRISVADGSSETMRIILNQLIWVLNLDCVFDTTSLVSITSRLQSGHKAACMPRPKKEKNQPPPACNCDCVRCDIGNHCGKRPLCQHPRWHEIDPKRKPPRGD